MSNKISKNTMTKISKLKIIFIFLAYQTVIYSFALSQNEIRNGSQSAMPKYGNTSSMRNHEFTDIYKNSELEEIPAIVPIAAEQQEYIVNLVNSMLEVVQQTKSPAENDVIFGNGEFFWPKDPSKPTKVSISYGVDNFKFRSISVGFNRNNPSSRWKSAGLSIHPRNFPYGFFEMKFSKKFFKGYTLEKIYSEERKNEAVKIVNVFLYKIQEKGHVIKLRFDASPTVSDIKDGYPKSFHYLSIDSD